jgi:hypothetical protein
MSVRKKLATAALLGTVVFGGTLTMAAPAMADDSSCYSGDACLWQNANKGGYFDGEYYADANFGTTSYQSCVDAGHFSCGMNDSISSILNYDSGKNEVVFSDSYGGGHYIVLTPLKYLPNLASIASSDGTQDINDAASSQCWSWSGMPSWCK